MVRGLAPRPRAARSTEPARRRAVEWLNGADTVANMIMRGGPEMGANGLLRFYMAHVLLLPVLLFVFTGVHYYKVIIHGHSLPPRTENIGEDTAKRVPLDKRAYFIPDVLTSEVMWFAVTTFIMIVLCVWFYHAPLESHADPQVTPLGTTAPWYFLWIQGALKLGDKTFWGVIFPTILLGFLMVVPRLSGSRRPDPLLRPHRLLLQDVHDHPHPSRDGMKHHSSPHPSGTSTIPGPPTSL